MVCVVSEEARNRRTNNKSSAATDAEEIFADGDLALVPGTEANLTVDVINAPHEGDIEAQAGDEELMDSDPPDPSTTVGKTKGKRGRPAGTTKTPEEFRRGKMVDLWSLVPPLPKKGEFDVRRIKQSLYFFS